MSETTTPTIKLNTTTDVQIPQVGFGCAFGDWTGGTDFQGFLPEQAWRAITLAIKTGYRHFDTARAYGTERHLGDVLGRHFSDGSLRREDVFLTTKLAHPLAPPHVAISHRRTWNPDEVPSVKQRMLDDFDISLDTAGVGYYDLVLLHWPGKFSGVDESAARQYRKEMWEAMESFLEKGTAKAIGVCNFTEKHLTQLFEDCKVKPAVNQIEVHPYCQPKSLIEFCQKHGITIEAFAPLASGALGLLQDPVITEIAEKFKRSTGEIILRWVVQQGMVVLPKSSSEKRMAQNLGIFGFSLSDEDMHRISQLQGSEPQRTCPDPSMIP